MKMTLFIMSFLMWLTLVFTTGCATQNPTSSTPVTPIVTAPVITETAIVKPEVTINATQISDMMSQAERCNGTVRFQAEIENDKTRARFSCEWTETEESQEWW